MKYKKRVRLKNFDYLGLYRYFVTICTYNKGKIFTNETIFRECITILKKKASVCNFKVWAYCFMPDHVHLLVEGKKEDSNLKFFITSFKQQTGYSFKNIKNIKLWQINFYDHVLRKEEDTIKIVEYIFNNPVRKEMVKDYRDYAFLGSFEFDSKQM